MEAHSDPHRLTAQHGVICDAQLLASGVRRKAIMYRVRSGRLVRLYPGVYAVGHAVLRTEGRWLAAVLACGPHAVLSHLSAAAAWGWLPPGAARIDVTVARRSGRVAPAGIRLHRVARLLPHEADVRDHVPITSPARTLLDGAAVLRPRQLEQLVLAAVEHGDFHLPAVRQVLADHPRRPGGPRLRAVLADLGERDAPEVRSGAELAFLELCDRRGLPTPSTNVPLLGYVVDAHWPGTDLIVELDGWAWHRGRASFERDRQRDQALVVAGFRVLRFTARQLQREPDDAQPAPRPSQ